MPPKGHSWKDLTWSWACSTGDPASDQALESAAQAAWPYALLCAWTFLNDQDAAYDLMDHAMQNASAYFTRHREVLSETLTARIKSVLRRRARQLAVRQGRELSYGSLQDLEGLYVGQSEVEQQAMANEMFARLSPFAQSVVRRRWLGYTWREIARQLNLDHTVVRRAYFRELESLLLSLSRSGDSPQ
ncbi:MAG TPA: hypothetical protein VMU57_15340 [Edaphobacter sp.]|uniref:hypothetical protein n=1 Tax=Edaphobacter sp. TaxID=1934404 RepID=UPI002CAC8917|nr:hypothetical protein [Edaphobacter sp.]HUZ96279.1 hypothetical protein [Edaphobacter sp.]